MDLASSGLNNYYNVANLTTSVSPAECLAVGVFLVGSGIFSGIWHLLALGAYFSFPGRFWTPVAIPFCLLMLSDLSNAGLQPFSGVAAIYQKWIWGSAGCQAYAFSVFLFGTCQLLCVPFVAWGRLRQIEKRESAKANQALAFVIILMSIFWATVPLCGLVRYNVTPARIMCTLDWTQNNIEFLSFAASYVLGVVILPGLIGLGLYSRLLFVIRKQHLTVDWSPHGKEAWIILGAFLSAYLSYAMYIVICVWMVLEEETTGVDDIPMQVHTTPPVVAKVAGLLHVVFYIWLNPKLMAAIRRMWGCRYDEAALACSTTYDGTATTPMSEKPHPPELTLLVDESTLRLKDHEHRPIPDDGNEPINMNVNLPNED